MTDYISFERHETLPSPHKKTPSPARPPSKPRQTPLNRPNLHFVPNVEKWLEQKASTVSYSIETPITDFIAGKTPRFPIKPTNVDHPTTEDAFFHIINQQEGPKSDYLQRYPGYRPPSILFTKENTQSPGTELTNTLGFLYSELFPFIKEHGDVYIKDEHGGGGGNLLRLFIHKGFLAAQTTNPELYSQLRQIQHEYRTMHLNITRLMALSSAGGYTEVQKREARIEKGKRLAIRWKRYIAETEKHPQKPTDKPILLGPFEAFTRRGMGGATQLAMTLPNMLKPGTPRLIAQKTIPHLKINNRPLEIRYIVQRNASGLYVVACHYVKLGGTRIASNIGQGGHIDQTVTALVTSLKKEFPKKSKRELTRIANSLANEGRRYAEQIMNDEHAHNQEVHVKTKETPTGAKIHNVTAPPILSTVDIVAMPKGDLLSPVVMEHHASGYFGLADDFKKGYISPRNWEQILTNNNANIKWVLAEAKRKLQA